MEKDKLIGKTLGWAARKMGFWAKWYRVYRLRDENDRDGQRIGEDHELKRILFEHPEMRRCRIASYEEYYDIRILRVREP